MVKLFIYIIIQAQLLGFLGLNNSDFLVRSANNNEKIDVSNPEGPLKKDLKKIGIKVSAKSVLVADLASDKILFEQDSERVLPIASLTKLMTALVFLETQTSLENKIEILASDQRNGGSSTLKKGEQVRVKDVFNLALIASDNNAVIALIRSAGMTEEEFVKLMNQKALSLNLKNTFFRDATGLSKQNVSSARDIYHLAKKSFSILEIDQALNKEEYAFQSSSGQFHVVKNTNKLLNSYLKLDVGKTGYTEEAGYCLVARAKNKDNHEVLAVVLNSLTRDRSFQESKALIQWAFDNFFWE